MDYPGTLLELRFQLPSGPTRIANESPNHFGAGAGECLHLIQRKLRMKGYFRFASNPIEGNDRQLLRANRASQINRNFAKRIEFVVREKVGQAFVGRAVEDQAMRPLLAVVRAEKQYRLTK